MFKRTFDIFCSAIGLIVLSPLFLILAIWISCDSRGGVFYRQERIGKGGTPFQLMKFRSMRVDSDKQGLLTIGSNDSRITRSGYVLRKSKMDELPQLINVLIGDMSFVGPRPEVKHYTDMYTLEQRHVFDVRPGITDAASIKYRNENELLSEQPEPEKYYIQVIMQDKLRINLDYVKHHSFWGDIKLIVKTFMTIITK